MGERPCYFFGVDLESLAKAHAEPPADSDGRRVRGRRTRESILQAAADLASVEGLEGLTIGRLATELGMSKSGLFAHFGSKEDLQIATYAAARERFAKAVIEPSRAMPRGRARLERLLNDWLDYFRAEVFRGVCFFKAVVPEYDSLPDSPVRQVVVDGVRDFQSFLAREARKAQEAGDLDPAIDPDQLAFELDALGSGANHQFQLFRDPKAFDVAAAAIHSRLDSLSPG